MIAGQKENIRELVKKYAAGDTESLISYVADTADMLVACRILVTSVEGQDSQVIAWLQKVCEESQVTSHSFLMEIARIVTLFPSVSYRNDHYAVLGVNPGASITEIKRAYRGLCRRYHPDLAADENRIDSDKFIAVNESYKALLTAQQRKEDKPQKQAIRRRHKKISRVTPEQRKKFFIWFFLLLAVLVTVSIFGSISFKKRAMLIGLGESRGSFLPPARISHVKIHQTILLITEQSCLVYSETELEESVVAKALLDKKGMSGTEEL